MISSMENYILLSILLCKSLYKTYTERSDYKVPGKKVRVLHDNFLQLCRGCIFSCLNSQHLPDILLALWHTSSLRRFNSHWTTFRKSNKNSPVLKQMLKMLPSWLNVLGTTAGHIIYFLEFLARNCCNPMTGTHWTPNINFFITKREFLNKFWFFCTPIPAITWIHLSM